VLGSIWAAVQEPLTPDRARAMCDAARLVALHLLRIRAGADVSRRLRADLVSTALEGGTGAFEAVRRLGLADQPVVVLALAVPDPAERARLADALRLPSDLMVLRIRAVTGVPGRRVGAVASGTGERSTG
jgi:hypothetical protein